MSEKGAKATTSQGVKPTDSPVKLTGWELSLSSAWQRYMADHQAVMLQKTMLRAGKPGQLLDFGCGHGRWTRMFMDAGWGAVCIDKNTQILARCQQANPNAKCIHVTNELRQLPFANGELNLVICVGVYHILESDWFLPEVRRVLAPGGLLTGAFFNKHSGRGLYGYLMTRWCNRLHCYSQSYSSWRKRADREGFENLAEEGLCWFPLSSVSSSPALPPLFRLEGALGLRRLTSFSPWVNFLMAKR